MKFTWKSIGNVYKFYRKSVGSTQEIPVNVRVVSATNQDLMQTISEGRFREDLFYRLNTFAIHVPALREHPEDISILAKYFLTRFAQELRKPIKGFTDGAIASLISRSFFGNVRELRNLIERAVLTCQGTHITPDDFQDFSIASGAGWVGRIGNLNLDALESDVIPEALRRANGNLTKAADLLGLSRDALRRRIARHNIDLSNFST